MGSGANQANGMSEAAVVLTEPIGGPDNGLCGSTESGATRDRRLADMTIEQAGGRDYPVMGLDAQHTSPNCHAASESVFRVHSGEGAQQINGLPGNHEEEPVAEEANGSSVHNACGDSYRPSETATGEGLPIREDVARLPVQEQGDRNAVPQAPILPPGEQPGEVSSMGNAEKPTENCCRPREIKEWNQQLTRSKPQEARKKKKALDPSFTFKITEVDQHRENETPIFSDAVYNDHQEKLVGIRIHPKGVGSGTGSHVALFIHMIKGDFDNSLVWPFADTITVSVLDQSDSSHRRDISRIIQANHLPAFRQPDETICRTGYGYERFARIEEFFGPRYVKDDKLLLKIEFSG
ncbi:TNF receptor-associated factor 6-like [Montipora foliosa]|uniref:TNF receptor-associated factor 6-like n=1 Tax=Montipora foliosa TaxID=591990 RepID=UPI0035F117DF